MEGFKKSENFAAVTDECSLTDHYREQQAPRGTDAPGGSQYPQELRGQRHPANPLVDSILSVSNNDSSMKCTFHNPPEPGTPFYIILHYIRLQCLWKEVAKSNSPIRLIITLSMMK